MALVERGGQRYGDSAADIREEIVRYSARNGYPAKQFADAVCKCGAREFGLNLDDAEGAALRVCDACKEAHPIGDSEEYLDDAVLEECACPCGGEHFAITVGVALYEDTKDVKWLYLGCRCAKCGLVAVYGDWKNEFEGYEALLSRV